MSLFQELTTALRATLVLWVLTALIYPFSMLGIGLLFPYQANGSLISNQGKLAGSALIGQQFSQAKYFWGRPSAVNYSGFDSKDQDPKNLVQANGISGGSNLAPSNPDLVKRVQATVKTFQQTAMTATPDLVYASGSGLDPHISPLAAKTQIERVARARNLKDSLIEEAIAKNTESRFLGIFGEASVNVLKLNLDLDLIAK